MTQNQQIAASKDMKKDYQSEEKFFYLKNKLIYPDKNSKIIFLFFSFLKNGEINSVLLQNLLCQKYLYDNLSLGIKSILLKLHHTTCKIVFCCDFLRNGF